MTDERMPTCPHCKRPLAPAEPEDETEPVETDRNRAAVLDDDEVRQAIIDSIEAGNRPLVAAAQAGIAQSTWYKWLQRGRDQRTRRVRGKYRDLLEEIEAAELRAEGRAVDIVSNGAIDDPRLALDFLKLRFHKDWQHNIAVIVSSERDAIKEALFNEFSSEADLPILERFFGALAGIVGAGTTHPNPPAPSLQSPAAGAVVDGSVAAADGARPAGLHPRDEPDVGGAAPSGAAREGSETNRSG